MLAFEPIPDTFELLAASVAKFHYDNVSLFNIAASDSPSIKGMALPRFDTGLDNHFRANITSNNPSFEVLCLPIDSFNLPLPISLVKIDAEGHDLNVLKGLKSILMKDHPVLIIEDGSSIIEAYLKEFGYTSERIDNSHNRIFS